MAGDEKRFKSAFDSLHALAYFAPEVDQALTGIGLRGRRRRVPGGRFRPAPLLRTKITLCSENRVRF
jgi:hypothetical protein